MTARMCNLVHLRFHTVSFFHSWLTGKCSPDIVIYIFIVSNQNLFNLPDIHGMKVF